MLTVKGSGLPMRGGGATGGKGLPMVGKGADGWEGYRWLGRLYRWEGLPEVGENLPMERFYGG